MCLRSAWEEAACLESTKSQGIGVLLSAYRGSQGDAFFSWLPFLSSVLHSNLGFTKSDRQKQRKLEGGKDVFLNQMSFEFLKLCISSYI